LIRRLEWRRLAKACVTGAANESVEAVFANPYKAKAGRAEIADDGRLADF
jgi:hypothetical protein